MAGNISWQPEDTSAPRSKAGSARQACHRSKDILEYMVYMGQDPFGVNRSLLGTASAGSSSFFVEANTPLLSFAYFLVYARLLCRSVKPPRRISGPLWQSKALQAQWPSWMSLSQHKITKSLISDASLIALRKSTQLPCKDCKMNQASRIYSFYINMMIVLDIE